MKTKHEPLNQTDMITSVLLIDNNDVDLFINQKILENFGVKHIKSFKNAKDALCYLSETNIYYQFILLDIYLPLTTGFEFIDKFIEIGLHKKNGEICLLSASINPLDKEQGTERHLKFIEKPLTMDKLFTTEVLSVNTY